MKFRIIQTLTLTLLSYSVQSTVKIQKQSQCFQNKYVINYTIKYDGYRL